jgi:plasmid segregation protein ParM
VSGRHNDRIPTCSDEPEDEITFISEDGMKTVRAADVGYGHVKYVKARSEKEITCEMFSSLAPIASNLEISTGLSETRDTIRIEVEGVYYEVGPGARLGLKAHNTRILHSDYSTTPEYLALLRGALAKMNAPGIDLLVVGLPVNLMNNRAQSLAQQLKGYHPLAEGRGVYVDHVWTLAQPLGGFLDFAMGQGLYETLADQMNLVVDAGYYTVDWLTGLGIKVMPERTSSFPGGTHAILQSLARSVSEELGVAYTDIDAIDRALEKGRLRVGGREIDLTQHWRQAQARIGESVNAIANSVGDGLDLNNIILVGGGAKYYESAIRRLFPTPRLIMSPDPIFANVRGFQIAGEHHASTVA